MSTALTDKEVHTAWADLQRRVKRGDTLAGRDAAVFALIVWAGCKPCECAKVNAEDVIGNGQQCSIRIDSERSIPSVELPGMNPMKTSRRARVLSDGVGYLARAASKLHTEERGSGSRPLVHRLVGAEFRRLTRWTIRDCWLRAVDRVGRTATCDDGRATYALAMLAREPFESVMQSMGITHKQTLRRYVDLYKATAATE